jgi:hypothetical protein
MKYETLGEPFEIRINCAELGLNDLGRLSKEMHAILNHVCISLYNHQNERDRERNHEITLPFIPYDFNRDEVLVRADVINIRKGSFVYDLQAMLAQVFSTAGAASIATNLISNVIWSIIHYAPELNLASNITVNGKYNKDGVLPIPPTTAKRQIKPRVEKLISSLANTPNGGSVKIVSGDDYVEIVVNGPGK